MTEHSLSQTVREFISDRVHTIEELEVLLLLHKCATKRWGASEVAGELGISESLCSAALTELAEHGLLGASEGKAATYQYDPLPELRGNVDELAHAYRTARIELIVLISKAAMERIRNAQLNAFAQAFLLKGPKRG